MSKKEKGVWFIVGPFVVIFLIFIFNSISQFTVVNLNAGIDVQNLMGNIFMILGIIIIILLIPSVIYGIVLLNKKDDNKQQENTITYTGKVPSKNFLFYFWINGRIGRLTYFITPIGIFFISFIIMALIISFMSTGGYLNDNSAFIIKTIVYIFVFWVYLANAVKRFHDINKSGWYALTIFIPGINLITYLILLFVRGTSGDNQYGADPFKVVSANK